MAGSTKAALQQRSCCPVPPPSISPMLHGGLVPSERDPRGYRVGTPHQPPVPRAAAAHLAKQGGDSPLRCEPAPGSFWGPQGSKEPLRAWSLGVAGCSQETEGREQRRPESSSEIPSHPIPIPSSCLHLLSPPPQAHPPPEHLGVSAATRVGTAAGVVSNPMRRRRHQETFRECRDGES